MNMSVVQGQDYYWAFTGDGTLDSAWLYLQSSDGSYVNNHWRINSLLFGGWTSIGYVDMGLNASFSLARSEDWLTLSNTITNTGHFRLNLKGVEYIDAPLDKNISLEVVSKEGFTTDGSLISLSMNVGNHTLNYWDAARDSTLFQGSGWDTVNLNDNPDIPGTQYWSLIRRGDGQIDAYSLFSGNRIRLEGGTVTWNNNNFTMNYGEVEKFFMKNARTGGTEMPEPGNVIPTTGEKYLDVNIDLRSYENGVNTYFSDSFNLAYFNYIRYTSDNIWTGESTIYDPYDALIPRYSVVSDTKVAGATSLPVAGTNRNGTHDLIVGEQASYIDGQLRLYAFNVASGSYNTFNDVFLGDSGADGKSYSGNAATAVDRVAMYGFGGNDILTGGAGNDYIFGGQGYYNQLTGDTGNQITGGAGADYFGVGNTNTSGAVTGSNTWGGYNSGQAQLGYAADRITDWHAGTDTLEVLSNGVAVISGLYGVSGMAGNNILDLRDNYASVVTVNQDGDNARGNDNWDSTQSLQYVYDNQTVRDLQSIKNEGSDVTVVNNGLIIARGQGGDDTVYGSPGNDYIYGNEGRNLLNLSEGGSDRAFLDTRQGKQYVSDFNTSGSDKFYLAKNIVDAFGGNSGRSMDIYDTRTAGYNYTTGSGYSQGIDFLYGVTYKAYLSNAYGAQPYTNDQSVSMDLSADITTYVSGIVSIAVGTALCFIPFVGPALGAPLIAAGVLLEAGKIYSDVGNTSLGSVPHINPVYDLTTGGASFTSNYVYVLNNSFQPGTTAASGGSIYTNDNLQFLDFFPEVYKNDGFVPALELNPGYWNAGDTGDGIYGYFVVYSNTETFVYLVTSQDHLIENYEATKVAELSGHRSAADFVVYDSNQDPYNQRADAAVVLKKPTIGAVTENSSPTFTANVPQFAYTASPYLKVTGSIASIDPAKIPTTTVTQVDLFDSNYSITQRVGTATVTNSSTTTTFTINDTRVLGQLIIQTDYNTTSGALNPLTMDNTFEYQDRRVIYYATIYNDVDGDGEMVIEARSNTFTVIDNGPSVATVDGGAGMDTLLLESTSAHLNNASDAQIVSIEMISVKPPMGPGLSVTVSGGAVTGVSILDAGAKIADGTYNLTLSDDTTVGESGATGWKVVVSGGMATSVIAGSGGTGYTSSTYANADWVPVGVTIDIHAQSEGFTVNGYQGADSIIGAQGNDVINGLNANDTIDGGTGNDTIEGGAGLDNLAGSSGGDTFVVTNVTDFASGETVTGGTNTGTVDRLQLSQVSVSGPSTAPVTSAATGTYASTQLSGTVTGVEVIELTVNAEYSLTLANGIYAGVDANGDGVEDNTLTITPTVNLSNNVTIVGGATTSTYELKVLDNGFLDGNDSITGGAGNDTLEGGLGNDTLSGGAIATYSGADSINAGGGNDLIVQALYQTVNDTIIGGADIDKLTVTQSNALTDLDNVTQVETVELLSGLGANFSYTISDASAFDIDTTGVTIDGDALASTEALVFSATNLSRSITILGGAGNDTIIDGAGGDSIVTNAGNDNITLSGAGANTVSSGSGTDSIILGAGTDWVDAGNNNDTVVGGANVTVADTLDGGAEIDLLTISNDNSTDDLNNVTRFETIRLAAGQSYQYVIGDGSLFDQDTVAVTVDAQALGAGDAINFDASNLDRSITILFGAGNDTIYGGNGTSDSINAGGGNDLIIMSNQLNATDSIDGGTGNDRLTFTDNGTATSDLNNVTNIEVITLGDAMTSVITVDTLVASGQTLTVDATGLSGTNTLNWDGSAESNGHFSVDGSGNNDTITGGAGNDTFTGGAGVDSLTGGNGNDVFVYNSAVADQTGAGETIAGGNNTDSIVVAGGSTMVNFSNDSISNVETLEMTLNVLGNADGNDQTVKMTDGQVDALSSINANDGTTSGSSDRIIISDTMTSDMLSNAAVGGGITVVNGTLTVELTEQSGATAQALTLAEGNLTSNSDLLKVDASMLTTNDTLSFDASAETTARVSVTGGVSDDAIVGSNANLTDTLSGGSGNDTIEGKAGVDSLLGNDGDDTFVYDSATTDATGSGETINGGNDTDRILVAGGNTAVNFSNDTIISIETLELAVDLAGTAESNNQQVTLTNNQADGLTTINANGDTVTVSNTMLSGMLDGTTVNGTLTVALTDQTGGTAVAQALTLVDSTLDDGVGDVLTLDGSGLTSDTLNFNGAAEDDSKVSVTGGAGHDTIVGTNSALTDTLDGGSGNDTIQGNAGADSLVGGDGNDTFVYNSASDESDAGEVIDGSSNTDRILVTGSGVTTVDFTNDTITSIETLDMTQDSVGAADGADQTVRMTNAQIDGLSTINSDAGSSSPTVSDTLIVSDAVTSSMLDGTVVSGTLTLQLSDQSGGTVVGQALTLVNATLGATDLLKVDASALSSDTFSFDASADSNSIVSVTGGAANDTLVGAASFLGDTLKGGLGNDSLVGGAGGDTLDGGDGTDVASYADITTGTSHGLTAISGVAINLSSAAISQATVANRYFTNWSGLAIKFGDGSTDLASNSVAYVIPSSATVDSAYERDTLISIEDATGSSLMDYLVGSSGANVLRGNAGNDQIFGGGGSDTLYGDEGVDLLSAERESTGVTMDGGTGSDFLIEGLGADSLLGGEGDDTFWLTDLTGSSQVIDGGNGIDRIWVMSVDPGTLDLSNDTIVSVETLDMLMTSDPQTVKMLNAQIDDMSNLLAKAGDLIILADTMTSGMLDGTTVNGVLTLQLNDATGNAITLVEGVMDANTDVLKIDGAGLTGTNALNVNAVNETTGAVSVTGGAANDTLVGTASSVGDTLLGGLGADSITGGAGHDSVLGGGGADTITMSVAASSIDTIDAGAQTDWLKLDGAASGTVVVNLDAGAGNDQITTINTVAESVLQTNFENLDASAMTGAGIYATALGTGSNIIGSAQNDTLLGGNAVDSLTGGGGVDYINGGPGVNSIIYTSWSQTTSGSTNYSAMDVIEANALEDQIDLSALSATSTISAVQGTWNGSTFTANSTGDDYVIGWSDAGSNANYVILKDTGSSSGLDLTLTSGVLTYAAKPATLSAMAPVVANGAGTALLSSGSTYNAGWMADNYTYTNDYYPSGFGLNQYFIPYVGMQEYFANQNVDILSVSLESAVLGKTNYAPNGSGGFSLPELAALNFSFSLNGGGTFSTPSTSSWRPEIWLDNVNTLGFEYDSYLDYGTIVAGASAGTQASPGWMGFMLFSNYGVSSASNTHKVSLVFGDRLLTSSDTEQKIIIKAGVSPNLFYAGWYFGTAGNNTYADASGDSMSVSDMMMGRGGNDSLDGGDLNDTLYGGFGNDAVGSGNDTLIGGAGDDYVWGEDGNDSLLGDGGVDTLLGGAGDDDITGGDGHDSVLGGDGADTITMSIDASSIDTIDAGNQTDWLVLTGAAAGTVVLNLNAGAGNDQLSSINSTAENIVQANFENLDASAMTGGGINATAISTGSNIIGSAQADTITGGNGNDTITGGAGGDSLTGGSGVDLFVLNAGDVAAGESYDGGGGNDTLQIKATTDFTGISTLDSIEVFILSQGVTATFDAAALTGDTIAMSGTNDNLGESVIVNGTSSGEAIDLSNITVDINDIAGISVTGLGGDDTITGTNGNDTLVGGAGADVLAGGTGNDTLVINSGDVASGESYDGGSNSDTLSITADMNLSVVTSMTGIETITLANGVDVTFSAAALTGDTLALNGTGDNAQETVSVTATAGNDTINLSGITVDTNDITGLYIDGAAGNDSISGTNGADTILGGIGDDSIAGGSGADSLVGGAGNDVFVYKALTDTDSAGTLANMDTIEGAAYGDIFDLSSFPGYDAGSFEVVAVVSGQDDYIASWTSGGVTYSVYLKDTGVTTGFASVESAGLLTLAEAIAPSTSDAVSLLSGNSTLTYVSPNYATDPAAVTNTATQFQDGNNATRITLSMGAIDAFLGWHKALGFSKQSDFTNTVLLTSTSVSTIPDLVVIDDSLTITGYPASSLNTAVNVDLMLDSKITWGGGSTDSSGLAVTTDGTNTYIFADVHYDRSAEDLTSVPMVNSSMYQRPLTGAKDAQLILTIAGLNDTTLISVADFVISGEVILGTSGADSKTGTTGDDGLHGGAGADTLSGGDGNDYLTGDASTGGGSIDWFLITSGNDTILDLAAGDAADVVQVSAGATVAATVYGNWTARVDTSNAGTATIDARGKTLVLTDATGPNGWYLKDTSTAATAFTGSAFADTIQGGEGADTITGGAGSDTASYSISAAGVTVSLALATAQVSTGDANGDVLSSIENLVGSAYADDLIGDGAGNIISGGAGNDTIKGGGGSDSLTGGSGADTFILEESNPASGHDTITDFTAGAGGDVLDFFGAAIYDVTILNHVYGASGADITLSNGAIYRLVDNSDGLLAPADFVLDATAGTNDANKNLIVGTGVSSWLIVGDSTADLSVEIYHVSNSAGTLAIEHLTSVTLVGTLNNIVAGNILV
jgi:Ca2+-binding RTX toxin-like protein